MRRATPQATLLRGGLASVAVACLLAGCASAPTGSPQAVPQPELELIGAGVLEIPRDCRAPDGAVFRTSFVVQPDGRVSGASADASLDCLQRALQAWVSSFRYRPVPRATPSTVDWMGVTAARGG